MQNICQKKSCNLYFFLGWFRSVRIKLYLGLAYKNALFIQKKTQLVFETVVACSISPLPPQL